MANRVGQQLGNYRLVRLIGEGGFADVYLGEHIHLGTQAAIKVLQMRLVGSNLEQFRNEARTIAGLSHPHIVRVYDFGVDEGVSFLVMDYAANGTLRQRHRRGTPVPPAIIVPYVTQVASALQHAHVRKLIHRDVKPENMLLNANNEVLLSDFGLVLIAQSTGSRSTQEMSGTAPYMAPEQLQGKSRPASDQYSLGIVVYEWLSGDCPFHGSFVEIASQHMLTSPAPLYGRIPGISRSLEQVVLTALAKDPQQRFATVQAFATAFEQAVQEAQVTRSAPGLVTIADESLMSTFVKPLLADPSQPGPGSGHTPSAGYSSTPGSASSAGQFPSPGGISPAGPGSGHSGASSAGPGSGHTPSAGQFSTQGGTSSQGGLSRTVFQPPFSPPQQPSEQHPPRQPLRRSVSSWRRPTRGCSRRTVLVGLAAVVAGVVGGELVAAVLARRPGSPSSPGPTPTGAPPSNGICPSGTVRCGNTCLNTSADLHNCGSCGHVCPSGQFCVSGQCRQPCPSGQTACNGTCLNTSTDPHNCGSCGHVCPSGETCSGGQCVCPAGQTHCNGSCVDTKSDPHNCGKCGNVCPSGQTCSAGQCIIICQSGTNCNGTCVDTNTDPSNCGRCGNVCASGQTCSAGQCIIDCQLRTNCNGTCVDLGSDNSNCGKCGNVCASGQTCSAGQCIIICQSAGQTPCNGTCVDLGSDNSNCGSCGNVCPVPTNGRATCSSGVCGITCNGGFTNCSSSCVDTSSDTSNCGSCGNVCSSGNCSNGMCCPAGQTNCNGTCVDTNTDPSNCGSCGNVCAPGQTCSAGQCIIICQSAGQTLCNGTCVDLGSDNSNCGSCGNVCAPGQTCSAGQCR